MALYDDYLDQNNLYSRPSEMMSNVNDYLGANRASLPMDANSLGSLMNNSSGTNTITLTRLDDTSGGDLPPIDDIDDNREGKNGKESGNNNGSTSSGSDGLLEKFIGQLEVLSESQRKNLLGFIGTSHGDKIPGVSSAEYAELYDISSDYAERFQGMPNLTSLLGDIENVFAYQNQQRGFEQRAAQQAQIQQGGKFQGGMGFSRFGRGKGMANALNRKQMQDTLEQRQGAVDEVVAGKYGSLLNNLASKITSGYNVAGDIVRENPSAKVDYGLEPQEGDKKYMNGINYIYIGGVWMNEQAYNEEKRAEGD
jgi:hypothetical protein